MKPEDLIWCQFLGKFSPAKLMLLTNSFGPLWFGLKSVLLLNKLLLFSSMSIMILA